MQLTFDGSYFLFECSFAQRDEAKAAGFKWENRRRLWYATSPIIAARLRQYASPAAYKELAKYFIMLSEWSNVLPKPPRPLKLKAHQEEATLFSLSRNRSYLRLDPGLGKTPIAATVVKALRSPCVYVTPPFLVRNVEAEFRQWAPHLKIDVFGQEIYGGVDVDVLIVPDSLMSAKDFSGALEASVSSAAAYKKGMVLVVDEAHRFKEDTAQRTKALFGVQNKRGEIEGGVYRHFARQVYLSGSAMPNRPMELYPVLSRCAPEAINFMSKFEYGKRYCAGFKNRFGWDFSGASNMAELEQKVVHPNGRFMLRMRKDVLDLPGRTEEIFIVSSEMSPRVAKMDADIGKRYSSAADLIKHQIKSSRGMGKDDDLHLATYRKYLGLEKVDVSVAYLSSLLDEGESVLVYAFHTEVIAALADRLKAYLPFVITGETPKDQRQRYVDEFQGSKSRRLFIGNFKSMGVGFTLTKARRVVFVEFSYSPGENDQAIDRCHRIGQKENVLAQYIVFSGSQDKRVVESLLVKKEATAYI